MESLMDHLRRCARCAPIREGALASFLASSPVCVAFGSISLARGVSDGRGGAPFQRRAAAAARRAKVPVLVVDPEVELEGAPVGMGKSMKIPRVVGKSWDF